MAIDYMAIDWLIAELIDRAGYL